MDYHLSLTQIRTMDMFVTGVGSHDPFSRWHQVKRVDDHNGHTTACDLYMTIVITAETFQDIPLLDELCQSDACSMRKAFSNELNQCAAENRQAEWTVRY